MLDHQIGPTTEEKISMDSNDIAIVGMASRLPGSRTPSEYWANLRGGVESVREFSEEELLAAGVPAKSLLDPDFVRAGATLDGLAEFDADFFGFSPKEAAIMDPQHRHFLEATWEALEDAGHMPETFDGHIGVFAGCGMNSYFMFNLLTNSDLVNEVGLFLLRHTGNDKDFLATRASYLLDLHGPSINVQTACSTSLVAVHLATQHLLSGECDLALAGGVTIEIPHGRGYQYHEGEVLSPDGHCRAFDHRSAGTVFGSGTGVVVLRRLDDAIADGDQIYAVIKGSAVNNDGSQKVGYLAPSVDGQAACIAEAIAVAEVEPETISYIECHGTGTAMGDPIEIAALTNAFRMGTDKTGFCAIGSVKTNIGHLDTAAGVASLIKVSLSLRHGELPPSLNFEQGNPNIDFDRSPFFVNDKLTEWHREGSVPRRAGVNSLGVGGTNAFAVLEEAPVVDAATSGEQWRLLVVSGKNRAALDRNTANLAAFFRAHPTVDFADVAWTLLTGRRHFPERRVLVARNVAEAADLLESLDTRRVFSHSSAGAERPIAFLFPGGGTQYPRMAADLHRSQPVFAEHLDNGLRLLESTHGLDLRSLLLCDEDDTERAAAELQAPGNQLPAVFIVEYALAMLLKSWGIAPTSLVGHSVGENTAACVSGTMSFSECLGLIVLRGQLTDRVVGGTVSVALSPAELQPLLDEFGLDLAVVNAPDLCVVSGDVQVLEHFEERLASDGIEFQRVKVNTAAHSRLLDPILGEFRAHLESMTLSAPSIRWVSNRTGTWITDEQAMDPGYWVDHLRHAVMYSDCVETLTADRDLVLLEVGPGKTMSSLARMNPGFKSTHSTIPTMRHPDESVDDEAYVLTALGRMWAIGVDVGIERWFSDGARRRISLPTYAFQRQQYFIEPGQGRSDAEDRDEFLVREPDESRWFWEPVWRRRDCDEFVTEQLCWLVIEDTVGIGGAATEQFRAEGDTVVTVRHGDSYQQVSDTEYVIAPENGRSSYDALLRDLVRTGHVPDRVAHLALLAIDDKQFRPGSSFFHRNQELGFQSLVFLAQAWSSEGIRRPLHISVATVGAQRAVPGDQLQWFEQSTVLGPARVIPREFPGVTVSTIDLDVDDLEAPSRTRTVLERLRQRVEAATGRELDDGRNRRTAGPTVLESLLEELRAPATNDTVALRAGQRLVQDVRRVKTQTDGDIELRQGGVVLVTGGLGGIGMAIAEELYETRGARLALLSRSALPDRNIWDSVVARLGADHPTSRRIAGVEALEELGAEVLTVVGDVTDVEQMRTVTETVRRRFGAINGVVHAAGIVNDELLAIKTESDIEEVLAPKVYGTLVLEDSVAQDDLDLFVVFASTSTVSAPIGQTDYVAANAFLNAFAESRYERGDRHVVALNWGVWCGVGMAADAAAEFVERVEPEPVIVDHPFFDSRVTDRRGVTMLTSRWTTANEWFLDDHRNGAGEALFPGAGYIELVRAALAELGVSQFEIRDLTFLRPLAVADGEEAVVSTVLVPTEEGYELTIRQQVVVGASSGEGGPSAGREGWRSTAQATLLLRALADPPPVDVAAVEAECGHRWSASSRQAEHLSFGPRWDVLRSVRRGETTAVARLALASAFAIDVDSVHLHPALVDIGTGFAMGLIDGYSGNNLWVPVGYRSIRVNDSLGAECVAIATAGVGSSETSGFASFDVTLCNPDGRVAVIVEGFTVKRLDGELDVGLGRPALASDVVFDEPGGSHRRLSQSEMLFHHNLRQGIQREEGKRAFRRALSLSQTPVVYASSLDLIGLRSQSEAAGHAQGEPLSGNSTVVFGRPELDSEYVEARNDVERTLVQIWQELLGIDDVGVADSFFDLGGHSLIAVRMFAKVKRTFSVEFPISVLFEAPTIGACARLISDAMPADAAENAEGDSTVVPSRPRYTHLVAMHPGEGGPELPFFLVAGMFGNVLNLRHLAHLIGTDRPFYGVQARGLYGGDQPHENFVEMARDYLEEIRAVQPHGPYMLGGFSGGGIAAFEMAQQLRATGEEVGLLVLLDTATAFNPPLRVSERVQIQIDNLRERGPAYAKDWLRNRIAWVYEKRRRSEGSGGQADSGSLHSEAIEIAFYRALERYETRHYHGVITLYRPALTPLHVFGQDRQINIDRRFIFDDNGWGPFCERLDVTEVPGDHSGMVLEPNVRVLATHMRSAIEAVEGSWSAQAATTTASD